jgi:predicted transcriptional regulator
VAGCPTQEEGREVELPRLGDLERRVLGRLWSHGATDVKAMHRAIGEERGITANTVHSALERLCRKRLVARSKRGRAYTYEATTSRQEWVARSLQDLLQHLPETGPELLLTSFVDLADREGEAQLHELERRVRDRRRRRRTGSGGSDPDPGAQGSDR